MRTSIFDQIKGLTGQFGADSDALSGALRSAASDPGFAVAQGNARDNAYGRYLNGGPALNNILSRFQKDQSSTIDPTFARTLSGGFVNEGIPGGVDKMVGAMRQRGSAEAGDTAANIQSDFNRAGLGFSTGNTQALAANRAAATARSDENEAAIRAQERALQATNRMSERQMQNQVASQRQQGLQDDNRFITSAKTQNYGTERAYQNNAGNQLANTQAPALNYLTQTSNAYLAPMSQIASIIQGLAGGGQIATPRTQVYEEKGWMNDVLGGVGALAGGAAGAVL